MYSTLSITRMVVAHGHILQLVSMVNIAETSVTCTSLVEYFKARHFRKNSVAVHHGCSISSHVVVVLPFRGD